MKKVMAICLMIGALSILSIQSAHARLLKQNNVPTTELDMQPYTNDAATLVSVCDEGGTTVAPATATLSSQLKACTCYTTTASTKVGAVKIKINGTDRWLRTYDGPQ